MRKLVVALTALAFVASFVTPAFAAATGTTTGKTVTKPAVKTMAKPMAKPAAKTVAKPAAKTTKVVCPKTGKVKKVQKPVVKGKKCVVKKKVAVAKPGKGPCPLGYKAKKMTVKYHKHVRTHKMSCWPSHKRTGAGPKVMKKKWTSTKRAYMCVPTKRVGAGPMKYHKHVKKSGKTCPRMPGQTY